ncbi:MAG: hypothetical protein WA709_02300 [Stellaceae bacterium]
MSSGWSAATGPKLPAAIKKARYPDMKPQHRASPIDSDMLNLLSPSRSFDFLGLQRRLPSGAKICYLSSTRRQVPGGSASADLGSSSF